MPIRLKTTASIIFIVFATTAATFFSGLYFSTGSLEKTMEQDLAFAIGIADSLVGTKMNLMKADAAVLAGRLAVTASVDDMTRLLPELFGTRPEISALSVFDRNGVITGYSEPAHDHDLTTHSAYMEMVYGGNTIISSPFYCSVHGEFVMNVYTPLGDGKILAVTVPGLTFSDMLARHRLWRSGAVFMLNEEGTFIGAADQEMVLAMRNYTTNVEKAPDQADAEIDVLMRKILTTDNGVERYHFHGAEHLCAYRSISSSVLGWRVAVSVPFDESPQAEALKGYAYAAALFLLIGTAAAFFLSRLIAQPFRKIEAQNRDLEKLNTTIGDSAAKLESALESARQANSAKSSFIAQMSHEIRTPLNAVIGLSELTLGEEALSREAETNLEKIRGAGATILSIVNDILDISKIESGKFEITPVRYDTLSLINDTVTLNTVRRGEKNITFTLHVDEHLPEALLGDDLRVKQIFNNLLSNAFKYTHSGSVEWRMSFERDDNGVLLVSDIRDTGIGIKPEDVQKLFSDYNQVDMQANRSVGGTGLGLAIAKRLAEMMDGGITVESEYGRGTTFHVRLRQGIVSGTPIGRAAADRLMDRRGALSGRGRAAKPAHVDLSYARVLVVDDIATNLDVVKGLMKPYGMKVDCAGGGRQAVEMIRAMSPRYSAVFMDHMMPEMDGVEAVRIIRDELGTEYARDIPIIALTANAVVGSEEMFLRGGFQDFISKPIDTTKLDVALRRWVRDRSREQSGDGARNAVAPGDGRPAGKAFFPAGTAVAGVDMQKALRRFHGDGAVLLDVLRSYAANTRLLLQTLRVCLATGKLEEYAVVIHGIKGASHGICAGRIGRAAEELEQAVKTESGAGLAAGHAAFEKAVQTLLDDMDRALDEIDAFRDKPARAEPDPLLLTEVRAACAAFDMDRVDAAMARLESCRYERGGDIVAWLREKVDKMDFEEIAGSTWPSAGGAA